MPSLFSAFGYKVYFWSNENGEPIHVHVCKGPPRTNATKIWITATGETLLSHNRDRIPDKDLNKLCDCIKANRRIIEALWKQYFHDLRYYC